MRISSLILFSCFTLALQAQQEQQYSQYMVNQFVINPAVAGSEDYIDLNLGFRSQWTGFEGSPITKYISGHGTVGKDMPEYHRKGEHTSWHGLGAYIYDDRTGPLSRFSAMFSYAYHLPLTKHLILSSGFSAGLKQVSVNSNYWKNIDDWSEVSFTEDMTKMLPDANIGFWLAQKNSFYMGLSINQIIGQELKFDEQVHEVSSGQGNLNRHFYFTSGIKTAINERLYLVPSLMLKGVRNTPLSLDLNGKLVFDDRHWVGFSYRHLDAVVFIGSIQIERRLQLSYSLDLSTSKLMNYHKGSHEVILSLRLNHPRNIDCPSSFW